MILIRYNYALLLFVTYLYSIGFHKKAVSHPVQERLHYSYEISQSYRIPYETIFSLSEGLVAVKIGNSWGFMNQKGLMEIQPIFQMADNFSEGLAAVVVNNVGYIDKKGKLVIEPLT